jgi:hypothetical protein
MHLGLSLRFLLIWCFQFLSLNDDLSDHNIRKFNFNLRQLHKEKQNIQKQRISFNKKQNIWNSIYNKYPASTCSVQGNNDNQNTRSEADLLNRLEKAFNKVTMQTKETKEKYRKLEIQTVVQEKTIINLETKLKDTKLNCPAEGKKQKFCTEIRLLRSTVKSLEKRLASEKQLVKNVRNINRKESKRLNEKVKYREGIAVKTRTEKNLEATAKNLEIEELNNKICMIEIESKTSKTNLQDEMENVEILQDLQEGIVDLTVKSQNGRYAFDTRTDVCVMDLLDCGIAYEEVSHAIKSVMYMCGLKSRNDVYPKKDYVANCNM